MLERSRVRHPRSVFCSLSLYLLVESKYSGFEFISDSPHMYQHRGIRLACMQEIGENWPPPYAHAYFLHTPPAYVRLTDPQIL